MMHSVRRIVFASLFLVTASIANAQWSGSGTVSQVWPHDGYYFVQTTITDNPCGSAGKFWWPATDSDAKDMYAMALAALVADKSIAVVFNENSLNCMFGGQMSTHMVINR